LIVEFKTELSRKFAKLDLNVANIGAAAYENNPYIENNMNARRERGGAFSFCEFNPVSRLII